MQKKSETVKFTGPDHDFRTQFDLSYDPTLFHKECQYSALGSEKDRNEEKDHEGIDDTLVEEIKDE